MSKMTTILLLLVAVSMTASAKLSVQLDADHVQLGQPFRLTLTDDTPHSHDKPDLTSLQANFTLLGTQQMSSYTVINGQARALNQWVFLLTPKHIGLLKIPPITLGQKKTKETQIEVTEEDGSAVVSSAQEEKVPAVKFVTEVSKREPYVNQQVIYTVKLYVHRRLLDADYQPPQVKDALMVSLGEPRRYQTTEKGIAYTVQELQYAFFPQKSGILNITPPQFQALVFDAVPGNIHIRAKPTSLHVQPAKIFNQNASWFPAKKVTLQEAYDNPSVNIKQGTMIVRTITLSVTGAAAQLVPKLLFKTNHQFSVYPESPTEETQYQKPNLKGRVIIKVTYLFNQSGAITIPELRLPWFNTILNQPEVVSLPARSIQVLPAASTSTSSTSRIQAQPLSTQTKTPPVVAQSFVPKPKVHSRLAWEVAAGFALAWLVTLLLWWWTRTSRTGNTIQKARKKVLVACHRHDPDAAKDALIAWGKQIEPKMFCVNLSDVESLVSSSDLKEAIHNLSQQLYQNKKQTWQGTELRHCFAMYKPEKIRVKKKEKSPLPSINP